MLSSTSQSPAKKKNRMDHEDNNDQDDDYEDDNDNNIENYQSMHHTNYSSQHVNNDGCDNDDNDNASGGSTISYGPYTKCNNFPFEDIQTECIQVELLPIAILIPLAAECNYTISKASTPYQSRQRNEFISLYKNCLEERGHKHLAKEFMVAYQGDHGPISATLYVEPETETTNIITPDDIALNTKSIVSSEIASAQTIIQVSVDMNAVGYLPKLVNDLNNQVKASVAAKNANTTTSCLKLCLSYTNSYRINEMPPCDKGCNQVLAMTIAQGKAIGLKVEPNINNPQTLSTTIEFLVKLCDQMNDNKPADQHSEIAIHHKQVSKKIGKMIDTLTRHQSECFNENSAYVFDGIPTDDTHRLVGVDIPVLLRGASQYLQFRFYTPQNQDPNTDRKIYKLISGNTGPHHNQDLHTMDEVIQALNVGVVCCFPTTNGNTVGKMCYMAKHSHSKEPISTLMQSLHTQTGLIISKLPVLNPDKIQKRLVMNDTTRAVTKDIQTVHSYTHIHISGITQEMYKNNKQLQNYLLQDGGVFQQLHIPNPHLYHARLGQLGYELHTLDIKSTGYIVDTQSLIFQLKEQFFTPLAIRSINAKLKDEKGNSTNFMVISTFMNQHQVEILHEGNEIMSLRPIPYQHVAHLSKLLLKHYRDKTLHNIILIAIKLNSKVQLKNNTIITAPEIALVFFTDVAGDRLECLKSSSVFNIPQTCTRTSTVLFYNTLTLQIAHLSKHFAYLGYPASMYANTSIKYCIVNNVHYDVSPDTLVVEIQKNPVMGHCIKYIYKIPLSQYSIDLVIALSIENLNPQEIIGNIEKSLRALKWYDETETRLEGICHHHGKDINRLFKFQDIQIIKHPVIPKSSWSSQSAVKTPKLHNSPSSKFTSSNSSVTNSSNNSSSSNSASAQKRTTINDYYKPHSTSDTLSRMNQE